MVSILKKVRSCNSSSNEYRPTEREIKSFQEYYKARNCSILEEELLERCIYLTRNNDENAYNYSICDLNKIYYINKVIENEQRINELSGFKFVIESVLFHDKSSKQKSSFIQLIESLQKIKEI